VRGHDHARQLGRAGLLHDHRNRAVGSLQRVGVEHDGTVATDDHQAARTFPFGLAVHRSQRARDVRWSERVEPGLGRCGARQARTIGSERERARRALHRSCGGGGAKEGVAQRSRHGVGEDFGDPLFVVSEERARSHSVQHDRAPGAPPVARHDAHLVAPTVGRDQAPKALNGPGILDLGPQASYPPVRPDHLREGERVLARTLAVEHGLFGARSVAARPCRRDHVARGEHQRCGIERDPCSHVVPDRTAQQRIYSRSEGMVVLAGRRDRFHAAGQVGGSHA
jgi:hypothetical protein